MFEQNTKFRFHVADSWQICSDVASVRGWEWKKPSEYRSIQDGFLKNGDPRIRSGGIQSDTISVANPTFDGNKIGRRGAACRGPGADTIFALGRKASFPSVPSAEILRRVAHTRCPLAYYVDTTELEIAITTVGSVTFLPFSLVQPPRSSGFIPSTCQLVYVFIFFFFFISFFISQWVQVRDRRLAEASSLVTSLLVFFPGHVSYETRPRNSG